MLMLDWILLGMLVIVLILMATSLSTNEKDWKWWHWIGLVVPMGIMVVTFIAVSTIAFPIYCIRYLINRKKVLTKEYFEFENYMIWLLSTKDERIKIFHEEE